MRGPETEKSHQERLLNGFYTAYCSGKGLDIGPLGGNHGRPVLSSAIGIDLDYPGYDGINLPFKDESQDYVFSSHALEHILDWYAAIGEWHRVVKVGGHVVICVPHQYLYEKKKDTPSRWNGDHKRFYTAATLLVEIDTALEPNTWRLEHCKDNDRGYTYDIGPDRHAGGCYEVECVIRKIKKPGWNLL